MAISINRDQCEFFYAVVQAEIQTDGICAGFQQHVIDLVNIDFEGFNRTRIGVAPCRGPIHSGLKWDEIRRALSHDVSMLNLGVKKYSSLQM